MVDRLLATGGTGAVAGGVATPWGEPCCLADDSCPFQSISSSSSMRLLPLINHTDCLYFPCLGRFEDARKDLVIARVSRQEWADRNSWKLALRC